jgi:ATP-dependent DNA helicase RecG
MTIENHYEMVHYKIDVLGKEEERDAHLEGKPYPLYSSKSGLKPDYIADAISRLLFLDI